MRVVLSADQWVGFCEKEADMLTFKNIITDKMNVDEVTRRFEEVTAEERGIWHITPQNRGFFTD